MKRFTKIWALMLAVMMIAVVGLAFADGPAALEENGEKGVAGNWDDPDAVRLTNKKIQIAKEITAFNPDESYIAGPNITYSYAIAQATGNELVNITDETGDHTSGLATTVTALEGVTTGVTMTGTAANVIAWTNADILEASPTGTANYKYLTVDFSSVVFTQPGVYRYKITETPGNDASANKVAAGVTDGTISDTRFLDVYVMRSATYTEETKGTAGAWDVYGYVCIGSDDKEVDIDPDFAKKTNGFVDVDGTTTTVTADQYRTYNLTLGKTLSGDAPMNGHKFPFDAAWTAGSATGTFQFLVEETGTASATKTASTVTKTVNGADISGTLYNVGGANVVGSADKDGSPLIAHQGTIKYIGIPNGTKVTVTETNDVTGTTYTTTATEKIGTGTAAAVAFDQDLSVGAALSTDKKTATNDPTDKVAYAEAAAPTADSNVEIQYTNTLSIISPTGYASRFAPYALILVAGIVLLIVAKKRKPASDED